MLFGMPNMNRHEAVTYLKDLLNVCNEMSPDAVSFENLQNDTSGYRLRIRGTIQECDKQKVRDIAKKHSLEVKENQNEVIVYTPLSETFKLVSATRTDIELNAER